MDNAFKIWLMAARPKTLAAGISPVVIGTAMAIKSGGFHGLSALCALAGAMLIQIGANFANDYADHVKGADTADRIGPLRATQAGLIAPGAMKWAAAAVFLAACLPGAYIAWRGGMAFIGIGLLSIACGVLYTAGPYPFGYMGLGDLFVLIFFGPVAVVGTYYVQALRWNGDIFLAGLSAGFFSVAILTVNNLRDIEQDKIAGKKTLAVRFGRAFAKCEYAITLVIAAVAIPFLLAARTGHWTVLLSSIAFLAALPTVKTVFTQTDGPSLNEALAGTGKWLLLFSIIFGVGWIL